MTRDSDEGRARRIVITRAGGGEAFSVERFEPERPGEGEVLVAVRAVGLNFADIFCRLGLYAAAPPFPFSPGFEVAGVVEAVGEGIESVQPGDGVIAVTRFGGYTTHLSASETRLRPLPEGWSFEEGAGFPVAALTAGYGLRHLGRVAAGETVVVTAAAGGVGTMACRLARAAGARVLGAVGSEGKRAAALEAGADEVVVSSRYEIWEEIRALTSGEGVDLILDSVGGVKLAEGYAQLRPEGRLVCYGFADLTPRSGRRNWPRLVWRYLRTPRFSPFDLVQRNRSVLGFNLVHLWDREQLFARATEELLAGGRADDVRPLIGKTFPFDQVAAAHAYLQSRRSVGKVVLTVE